MSIDMLLFMITVSMVIIIVVVMLIDWLNEPLRWFVIMVVVKHAMLNFITITVMMSSVSLSMMNTMLWLVDVATDVLMVLMRMIAVSISSLATVEGIMRLFMHGLLNDEVNGIVRQVMVIKTRILPLVHFVGTSMIMSERLLLHDNPVTLVVTVEMGHFS